MNQAATRTLEAVAVFHDPTALNGAISDLVGAGVDRAEMSILAREGYLDGDLVKNYADMRHAEDDPNAPRHAVYADTDVRQGRTLLTSMASVVAALAASGAVVATGGAALPAIAAAIAAGGGVGAIGAMVGRQAGAEQRKFLEIQLARGGILLWVKIAEPANEPRIRAILLRHAGDDVHVRDVTGEP